MVNQFCYSVSILWQKQGSNEATVSVCHSCYRLTPQFLLSSLKIYRHAVSLRSTSTAHIKQPCFTVNALFLNLLSALNICLYATHSETSLASLIKLATGGYGGHMKSIIVEYKNTEVERRETGQLIMQYN